MRLIQQRAFHLSLPTLGLTNSRNWEDEQWELTEVKDDLKLVMHKGTTVHLLFHYLSLGADLVSGAREMAIVLQGL